MRKTLAAHLACWADAYYRCVRNGNTEWMGRHRDAIIRACDRHMPSGSGFDAGVKLDLDQSSGDKLVFRFGYHPMNDVGCYVDWTEHTVTVTPAFYGVDLEIKTHGDLPDEDYDLDGFEDMVVEMFQDYLTRTYEHTEEGLK